jgi:hypothetical protein
MMGKSSFTRLIVVWGERSFILDNKQQIISKVAGTK